MNARYLLKAMAVGAAWALLVWGAAGVVQGETTAVQIGTSPHKCSDCHTCARPTPAERCLQPFARGWSLRGPDATRLHAQDGPAVAVLAALENVYEPVRFDHGHHAEMAEMGAGCVACHHYTPNGASHPPCRDCHGVSPAAMKTAELGLKGAYHRRCMGCHREWSGEDACENCHLAKAAAARREPGYAAGAPRTCQEPQRKVYETTQAQGRFVTFFHQNHSRHYGLTCNECHRQDSCVACHYQGAKPVAVVKAEADAMHHKCAACHDIQSASGCGKCHAPEARAVFSHAQAAGWELRPYHALLTCASCHPEGRRLARLDKTCNDCHGGWEPDTFRHAVVGLALDEDHRDNECKDCHLKRRFDKPPSCAECHDDKRYPRDVPGKKVGTPARRAR